MRTVCFVDGYNLYYGLLASTPHKWLNLPALLREILRIQNPNISIVEIQYFSAPVKPSIASRGVASLHAQNTYIRALKAQDVVVHMGRHQLEPARAPRYTEGVPPTRGDQVAIWKLEEKQTDVSIALSLYRTVAKSSTADPLTSVEQIVLLSADTDLAPALRAIREDFPDITIGTIFPHREFGNRPPPGSLMDYSHWTRRHITEEELTMNQFSNKVATRKKPAVKPDFW